MKPEEKAKELINNFQYESSNEIDGQITWSQAKQCALICVDEIIKTDPQKIEYVGDKIDPLMYDKKCQADTVFWIRVKQEIEES